MPTFTWASGVPNTGALKTSYLSKKLYMAAIAECVFVEHVSTESGFGKGAGESVTYPRISNMTESIDYSLSETERIPEKAHTVTGKVVTVSEFGAAVPFTSFARDLSQFNLKNTVQMKLKEDMRLALDIRACRAFKQTLYKYVPTGASSASTATNGTAPTAALANMNVYHAGAIRDILYDTFKAPTVDGSNYVGIFRTKGLRGIKDDPDWEFWNQYVNPQAKFNSEVGKMEGIRFVESNHGGTAVTAGGLNIVGTGSVLGEGVIFGDDAVVLVEALSPTLRMAVPDDFDRRQAVAWYGIYEFSIVWDTASAGENRIVHVTST